MTPSHTSLTSGAVRWIVLLLAMAAAGLVVGLLVVGSSDAGSPSSPPPLTGATDATQVYSALTKSQTAAARPLTSREVEKIAVMRDKYVPALDTRTAVAASERGSDREILVGGEGRACLVTFVDGDPAGFTCQALGPKADAYRPGGAYGQLTEGGFLYRGLAPDGVADVVLATADGAEIPLTASSNVLLAHVDSRPTQIRWRSPNGEVRLTDLPSAADEEIAPPQDTGNR